MKKLTVLIMIFFMLGVALQAQNIPQNAELLGELNVRFRAENDELRLLSEGRFRSLILEAEGNDIEIDRMVVIYGNGTRDEIPLRQRFNEDTRSRRIDLEGNRRFIRRIEFWYSTEGRLREGRATLKVYGIK